jgi:hypothetical protein
VNHLNQMKQLLKKRRVTKKRRKIYPIWAQDRSTRIAKKPSSKSFIKLLKNCDCYNIWLFKEFAVGFALWLKKRREIDQLCMRYARCFNDWWKHVQDMYLPDLWLIDWWIYRYYRWECYR